MKLFETNEKITEKAFTRSLITSVISILMCMAALCSMTYAWFAEDISSDKNQLRSGRFDLSVEVSESEDGVTFFDARTVEITDNGRGGKECILPDAGIEYTVTLKITDDTTASKGFCVLSTDNASYSTELIYRNDENDVFTFKITTSEAGKRVTFSPVLGIPAYEDILCGGVLTL